MTTKQTKKVQVIKSNTKVKSPYKKGDFGYWWTVECGKPDICGRTFPGNLTVPRDIASLKGCPEFVEGDFYCHYCTELKDLDGGPSFVKGDFSLSFAHNLESLKGCPVTVGGNFICKHAGKFEDLKGSPMEVGGDFIIFSAFLTSLKGMTRKVKGNVELNCERHIKNLNGISDYIGGDLACCFDLSEDSIENYNMKVFENRLTLLGVFFAPNGNLYSWGDEIDDDSEEAHDYEDTFYF